MYIYAPVSSGTTPEVFFWDNTFRTHLVPGTLPDSLRAGVALLGSSKVGKKTSTPDVNLTIFWGKMSGFLFSFLRGYVGWAKKCSFFYFSDSGIKCG